MYVLACWLFLPEGIFIPVTIAFDQAIVLRDVLYRYPRICVSSYHEVHSHMAAECHAPTTCDGLSVTKDKHAL